jgi:hypothetical protein
LTSAGIHSDIAEFEIRISFPESMNCRRFQVTVVGARDLHNADMMGGKSDPYCICQVYPASHQHSKQSLFRTATVNNNSSPEWNCIGDITCYLGQSIEFQVWDSDPFPLPDELLGTAVLPPGALHGDFDNKGIFDGELQLFDNGLARKAKGVVIVKVEAVDVAAEDQEGADVQVEGGHFNKWTSKYLHAAPLTPKGNGSSASLVP